MTKSQILKNTGRIKGIFNNSPLEFTTNEVQTFLVPDLVATKNVDYQMAKCNILSYTIVLTNNTAKDYLNFHFTDHINPLIAPLVINSVQVNDKNCVYRYERDGTLVVKLGHIKANTTTNITFKLYKAKNKCFHQCYGYLWNRALFFNNETLVWTNDNYIWMMW